MKRVVFLLCMLGAACTHVPENEFHIEGNIAGLADSVVITLLKYEGQMGMSIDRDTVVGGRFSFVVPMTENARLGLSGFSAWREIWAVPGEKVTVTGDSTLIQTWRVKSRVPEQAEADRYIFESENEYIRHQQLSIEKDRARANITDVDIMRATRDSLRALEDEIQFAIFRNDIALMDKTPVSDIWLDNLEIIAMMIGAYETYGVFREDAVRLYERLTTEQREFPAAQTIKFALFPPEKVEVGDEMADAELKAFDGTMHRLSDYRGKYIVLDFWATGCAPCYYSMPELKALGEKYRETVKIIGINLDTTEEGWRQGTETFKPSELNLNAPPASDIDERYGVSGIPHYVIISPEGIVLDSWAGYASGLIERRLAECMNK